MMGLTPCVAMPDEPAWGQFRRLAKENGLHSPKALRKLVPDGGSRDEWLAVRRRLAHLMSGTTRPHELIDYFKNHCIYSQLLAFSCLVDLWRSLVFRWASHHGNLYPSRLVVRSCPECAREDIEQFGFAWYRQGHQLPGVDWCFRHSTPLYQVPSGLDLIGPKSWRSYQVPLTSAEPRLLPSFIHRYLRALEWLRHAKHRSAWSEFESAVNCVAFGPKAPDYKDLDALGDLIGAAAPDDWYHAHFVEPQKTRTRPIACPDGLNSPVLALRAACVTNSDSDLDELFSTTAVAVEATNERIRQWLRSGGRSASTAESLPKGRS